MASKKHFLDNPVEYFHTLNLVFYWAVSLPLILFCVVYLNRMEAGGLDEDIHFGWVHAATIVGMIASSWLAYRTYRQQFLRYDVSAPFRDRLRFFHRTVRYKYVWLAVANLLPVAGLYLVSEQFFLALYAIALILFSLNRPTVKRVTHDLALDGAEQAKLKSYDDFDAHG